MLFALTHTLGFIQSVSQLRLVSGYLLSEVQNVTVFNKRKDPNYRNVHKFINLAILYNDEISAYKFSDFMNWCNQLATGLVCTNLSDKPKNAKITKFNVSLTLCTLR